MKNASGIGILSKLGYDFNDIVKIAGFKFSFEVQSNVDYRLKLGYEHAARLYKVFEGNSGTARMLYDFVDVRRNSLEKTVSSSEVVEELEDNLDYWNGLLEEEIQACRNLLNED